MLTRRQILAGSGALALGAGATGAYAVAGETMLTPQVTHYAVMPPLWPAGLTLRIAVIADLHACEPWMSADRIHGIAAQCNALAPDLILLLGDFNAGHRFVSRPVMPGAWAEALSGLRAPLGTFAILGNHDWWHGPVPGLKGGPDEVRQALRGIGVPVLENEALPIDHRGRRFWLAGLGDQNAFHDRPQGHRGVDDLPATLRQIPEGAPIVMMAHEPWIFARMPERVSLTLSGHTHGGQVVLPGIGPLTTPSRRYNYGHVVENGRHLIVSGGLGESGFPARLGVPPEILDIAVVSPDLSA